MMYQLWQWSSVAHSFWPRPVRLGIILCSVEYLIQLLRENPSVYWKRA